MTHADIPSIWDEDTPADAIGRHLDAKGFYPFGIGVPSAARTALGEWLTAHAGDDFVAIEHARWHDQPGNMLYDGDCGWEQCEFWPVGLWMVEAVLAMLHPVEEDE